MSVASLILESFRKRTPLQEAFDVKVIGFDENSNDFYVGIGGVNYKYTLKDGSEKIPVLKEFYRNSNNPAKALAKLKNHANSEKIDKIPSGLTVIKSIKDIDKLNSSSSDLEK